MATTFNGSFIAGKLFVYYTDSFLITEQDIIDAINEIGVDYTLPGWSMSLIAPNNTVVWSKDFQYGIDGESYTTYFGDDKSPVSEIYPILNAVVTAPNGNTYILASGDFLAGSHAGYFAGTDINLGDLLTGELPSNTDGFSGILSIVGTDETFTNIPGITNIISLTINDIAVDISTQSSDGGGISLFGIDLGFEDGETYTFSLVADLVSNPVWYRFKALGTQWTDIVSGYPNNVIKQVSGSGRTTYVSNGYSYFDFLTADVVGTITFGDGNGGTIEATSVPVTLQEFSSSGSFTAGTGFGGAAIGYVDSTALGSWGTLNSGEYPPAIPLRYEGGQIPAGSIVFSDILQPVVPKDIMLITAPILLQLSINDNSIDLTGVKYGGTNGTAFDDYQNPPRTKFGFVDGETYTFSMTWGELVETTFITSKAVNEFINITVQTTTGYWKYNHNGTDSSVFNQNDGTQSIEVLNANGEFTIISCLSDGTVSGDITNLNLSNNGLTSFDGTGLTSLIELDLTNNGLTSFNGTDLTSLTYLYLNDNGLTEFDGTDLTSLTYLDLNNNGLTSFDGTDLTSLTQLFLAGNLLTGLDVSPMTSLTSLALNEKGDTNPLTSAANDSILNQLEANGLENGSFSTINWRTDAGTADFNTLISRGWTIEGANLKPTFKLDTSSGTFQITVDTTSGFWKYFHDGAWSEVFDTGNYAGGVEIITTAVDGEFILESCDDEGNKDGDIIEISCKDSLISEFYGDQLGTLVILDLSGNQLTSLDVSPMTGLTQLITSDNLLTTSSNDSILNGLESNGLTNGVFTTTGGRTSAGTADYNTLISRGWTIEGASIPQWYRFKAPSTQAWDGVIGVDSNEVLKEVWLYQSAGFTYYDFLTTQSIGEVRFNIQGSEIEIVATGVQVTLQEFSSSGSFTAGIGLEGNAVGYANTTDFGNWGTLNSGTLPAIPSRYEGDVPAGSVIFSDATLEDGSICVITAPILLSLTVNGNEISLTGINGNPTGTKIPTIGFGENDEVTFSMTWGELVEVAPNPTFITSKAVNEFISITVETSTGYWKYNHNGTDSSVFNQNGPDGSQSVEVLDANGEFTIISCDDEGTVSGDITRLDLVNNGLTSFDGTGLSGLTILNLYNNQLTSFNGTGLSGLTSLNLGDNQLTSFFGTGLTSLTELDLASNGLTTFNGTVLTSLTYLYLPGNLLTGLDVSPMTSLTNLTLNEKEGTNPLTSAANDSILNQLEANGLSNGIFNTIGGRTAAGTADYNTLISRGWDIIGAGLPIWYRAKRYDSQKVFTSYNLNGITAERENFYHKNNYCVLDFSTFDNVYDGDTVNFADAGNNTTSVSLTPITLEEQTYSGSFVAGKKYVYYTELPTDNQTIIDAVNDGSINTWTSSLVAPDSTVVWSGPVDIVEKGDGFEIRFGGNGTPILEYYPSLDAVLTNTNAESFTVDSGNFIDAELTGYIDSVDLQVGQLLSGHFPINHATQISGLLDISGKDTNLRTWGGKELLSLSINGTPIDITNVVLVELGFSLPSLYGFEDGVTYTFSITIKNIVEVPGTWYRFKAPSTSAWDGIIGINFDIASNQVWFRQFEGYTYLDVRTTQDLSTQAVYFNIQGTGNSILATNVPITVNEITSSGSFTSGLTNIGVDVVGYGQSAIGNLGTLNSGQLPAIPVKFNSDVLPVGDKLFIEGPIGENGALMTVISTPYLSYIEVNGNIVDLTAINGSSNGLTAFYPSIGNFVNGEEATFNITWAELVETVIPNTVRKLRVKGISQQN